jgi:hypothetical protein
MSNKPLAVFKKRLPQFKQAALFAALDILSFWSDLVNRSQGDPWFEVKSRQAFNDAMNCLIRQKVIENFDVVRTAVKFEGKWYYKYPEKNESHQSST